MKVVITMMMRMFLQRKMIWVAGGVPYVAWERRGDLPMGWNRMIMNILQIEEAGKKVLVNGCLKWAF